MNSALVFVVCGKVQHGKSTLGKCISEICGKPFADTSSVITKKVANDLGITVDQLKTLPKEEVRQNYVEAGDALCDPDPGFLAKKLYFGSSSRVIAGVRRCTELQSFIEEVGRDYVVTIWIDRPDGPEIRDNTDLSLREKADIIVHNEGAVTDLVPIAGAVTLITEVPRCLVELRPR